MDVVEDDATRIARDLIASGFKRLPRWYEFWRWGEERPNSQVLFWVGYILEDEQNERQGCQ